MPNYGYLNSFVALAGHLYGAWLSQLSRIAGGAAKQITTFQITTATQGATYAFDVTTPEGEVRAISFVAVGATATLIAAEAAAALNLDALAGSAIVATSATDVVTCTGLVPGESFTITESDAKIGTPSTTTSAAAAGAIPFGRGVVKVAGGLGEVQLPDNANATAKVVTVTTGGTPTAEEIYTVTIIGDFDGLGERPYVFPIRDTTGPPTAATLVDAWVAAINASGALPTLSVTASNVTNVLTLTGDIEGMDFRVSVSVTDDAGGTATGTLTKAISVPRVGLFFEGVAIHSHEVADTDDDGVAQYAGGDTLGVLDKGHIFVPLDASEDPSEGDPVFLRFEATGTEVLGAFRASDQDGGDCMLIPSSRAKWAKTSKTDVGAITGRDGKLLALLELL